MMKLLDFIILVYYLFNCYHCGTLPASQLAEQTLITSLLNGYNKNIRPDGEVSVDITASLQQIVSIDEKQQIMASSSFISQTWFDDRLAWTPNSSNNIEVVMLPVISLWIPDTMVLNSADTSGYFIVSAYSLASVYYTGQVYIILPALTIRNKKGSNRIAYTENGSLVIDISEYTEHPVWELNGTDLVVLHAEDRSPFEDTFNDVISIQLYLRRKPLFFIMNDIFACLVLNCVTLLAYALPFATQVALCKNIFSSRILNKTYRINSVSVFLGMTCLNIYLYFYLPNKIG